jgi:TonB family protein
MILRNRPRCINRAVAIAAILAAVSVILMATSSAFAQQPELYDLAQKLAKAISKSHAKSVVVFDFTDLEGRRVELGSALADDLSSALGKADERYRVIPREDLHKVLPIQHLPDLGVLTVDLARPWAAQVGAEAVVIGKLAALDNFATLDLQCYSVLKDKKLAELKADIPVPAERLPLLAKVAQSAALVPHAGLAGYGVPQCIRCPRPEYSQAAVQQKVEGIVVLSVVITPDGHATNIRVLKSLGNGLDEKAVEAVRRWQFKPAVGPDGKPTPVQAIIQVRFRLLN